MFPSRFSVPAILNGYAGFPPPDAPSGSDAADFPRSQSRRSLNEFRSVPLPDIRTLPDALLPPEHSEHFCFSPVLWHTE